MSVTACGALRASRTCQAPGCDQALPPRRRRFCSDECRAISRRGISLDDELAIHAEIEAYRDAFHEMINRHTAELTELKQRHDRELRKIPGYPRWAGWKAIRK